MTTANREQELAAADDLLDRQRSLVKRVVASATFARSERLSSFLVCICELTFSSKADQINEQKIGISVFGRQPGYDSAVDGIVRTQASRLRQRLDAYFSNEGANEGLRIVLPRGGYVPRFEPRLAEFQVAHTSGVETRPLKPDTPSDPDTAALAIGDTLAKRSMHMLPWVLCGVLALCLIAIIALHSHDARRLTSKLPSNHSPLWQRLFTKSRATLLVPADSGLVLFEGMTKREVSLSEYIRGDYRMMPAPADDPIRLPQWRAANGRYTSIVDLEMMSGLSSLAGDRDSNLSIRYARDLRPNDLKSTNVILSGAAQANPWVRLFEPHMNFILQNNAKSDVFSVINRAPMQGEPKHWDSSLDDPDHRVYGVIAFLTSLTGDGDVLILEGTSMSGTEAAWDFVSDDAKMLPILNRISRSDGALPHFEILVGTSNIGSSAVENSALAWRVSR